MKCVSGKHEWIDPTSAQRCCAPAWRRVLRRADEVTPGEARGGAIDVDGESLVWVWCREPAQGSAATSYALGDSGSSAIQATR